AAFEQRFLSFPRLLPDFGNSGQLLARLGSPDGVTITELQIEAILALEAAMTSVAHTLDVCEFAEIVETDNANTVALVWSTTSPRFSRAIADVAITGLNEILGASPLPLEGQAGVAFDAQLSQLKQKAERRRLSASNAVLIQAARSRDIPCVRTSSTHVRLGEGRFQTLLRSSSTGNTSYAATRLSINKRLTNRRLSELLLPVPKQKRARNAQRAVAAAEQIGYPVVVKPAKGSRGAGITAGAQNAEDVKHAFRLAHEAGDDVVVERFLDGDDHRLLIVGDRFIAGVKRIAATITGDGQQTIAKLVTELNKDPARDDYRLFKIALDNDLAQHLKRYGHKLDTILEAGTILPLRSVANVTRGGIPIDVTDSVHPDNRSAATRAARGIGLDVAGIDIVTTDIGRPLRETGGGIIEVNARPGLDLHTWPRHGQPRDVGRIVMDLMYPDGASTPVAKAVIVGDKRTAVVARDLDQFLRSAGQSVGLVIRNTAFVNGQRSELNKRQKRSAARLMLRDPEIETLVYTMSPAGVLRRGLQVTRTDVAAVAAPDTGTDPIEYLGSLEILLRLEPRLLVVGAGNRLALEALQAVAPERIMLVSQRGLTRRVNRHIRNSGRATVLEWVGGDRQITIYDGNQISATIPVGVRAHSQEQQADNELVGTTGRRSRRIGTRMFAAALGQGLGLSDEAIAIAIAQAPPLVK
ncbi:MAG: hypothetical protein ACR2O4_16745, partial [Hyphomicrobiaceae bacterium]